MADRSQWSWKQNWAEGSEAECLFWNGRNGRLCVYPQILCKVPFPLENPFPATIPGHFGAYTLDLMMLPRIQEKRHSQSVLRQTDFLGSQWRSARKAPSAGQPQLSSLWLPPPPLTPSPTMCHPLGHLLQEFRLLMASTSACYQLFREKQKAGHGEAVMFKGE